MEDFELIFDFRMSGWSGIGRYSTNLIRQFIRLKKPTNLILLGIESDFEKLKEVENVSNITRIILKEPVFSLSNFIGLGKKASIVKASNLNSVLHVPHFTASLLDTENLVVTIHDLMPLKYPIISRKKRAIYRIWNLIAARKAKRIITVSNFVKRDIVRMLGVKEEKIDVIHLAPDEIFFNSSKNSENFNLDYEYALSFSNWKYHKGLDIVLHSLKFWPEDLKLVLVGKKPSEKEVSKDLFDLLEKYCRGGKIVFTGSITDEELKSYYHQARMYIHPSREEGFGLPPLEAMACKTPVISSKIEVSREVFKDSVLYYETENPKDLAEKVVKLYKSNDLVLELVERSKDLLKNYSWKKTAKMTLETYIKAMS